jgi:hypothetical protein
MKNIKAFTLAIAAATVAMALIGAAPAMAGNTAMCSSNEAGALTCAAEKQVTTFHAVALNSIFLTELLNVECKTALAEGTILALGAPQVGHLTKFNWTNCSSGCTVTTTQLGSLLFLKTTSNLGELTYDKLIFKISCFGFINCEYTPVGSTHLLGATGLLGDSGESSNGGFGRTEVSLAPSSPVDAPCPAASWHFFYESLTPLWVKT